MVPLFSHTIIVNACTWGHVILQMLNRFSETADFLNGQKQKYKHNNKSKENSVANILLYAFCKWKKREQNNLIYKEKCKRDKGKSK